MFGCFIVRGLAVEMVFGERLIDGDDFDIPTSFHPCLSAALVGEISGENLQEEAAQFAVRRIGAFEEIGLHEVAEETLSQILCVLNVEAAPAREDVKGQPIGCAQIGKSGLLKVCLIAISRLKHKRPAGGREIGVMIACCHAGVTMAETLAGATDAQVSTGKSVLVDLRVLVCSSLAVVPTLNILKGLDPVGLFDRATDKPMRLDAGEWEAPTVSEVASEFPAFAVMELTGRGGMGVVYRALQPDIEREVAIKLLPPELSLDPEFAERFRREAKLMASLQHEGLVAVYDFGETPSGNLFYVMEFVPGGDLAKRWKAGPMGANEVVAMIEQISAAVACAHEAGIVHRDLKPANIMLATNGAPKVMDFGLARPVAVQSALSQLTLPDVAMGTPDYAAPEQLLAIAQPTTAMDVYSLGVIAYEALTGQLPRGVFDPPSKLNSEVDPAFDAVILQALQSDPSRRFADAGAFRQAWLRAADFRLQQQLRERETRLKLLRRTRLAFAFGLVALVAVAAAAYGYWQQQRAFASRQSAEQMVDLIVDRMHGKLQDVGRVDLLADVDAEVGSYYAALPADERSPARVLSEARFFQRRASMLRLKGDWDDAITSAHRAADLLVPAAHAAPGDVDSFVEAAQSLSTIAYMNALRKDTAAGLPAAERMVAFVVAAMPRLPPDHRQVLFYYSRSLRRLADQQVLLERFDEAQKNYLRSAAAIQRTIAQPKPGPDLFTEAAQVESDIGDLAVKRNAFDLAIQHYQIALDMQQKAVKPGIFKLSVAGHLQGLNSYIAGAYQKKGDFAAAKPFIEGCWTYTEQILKRSPGSTAALEAERYYYRVLAPDLEHDGKHEEAQAAIKKANEAYAKWNKLKIGVAGD